MHQRVGTTAAEYAGVGFGKLLLFGEHAAVYGYPALGMALPLRTTVRLVDEGPTTEPNPATELDVTTEQGPDAERNLDKVGRMLSLPELPENDQEIVRALWADLLRISVDTSAAKHRNSILSHLRKRQFTLRVWSNVPRSRGLGSSAAACAALAGAWTALAAESKLGGTEPAIWLLAHRLEHRFHGTPSGIDTGLAVHGGCRSFLFHGGELPETHALPPPAFPVVAAAVPRQSNTKALVADIRSRREAGDPAVDQALAQLGRISEQAVNAVASGAPAETVAAAANEADALLVALELDSEQVRYGLRMAREYGALGGKISGAGGGGAFLAIFAPNQAGAAAEFAAALPGRLQEQGGEAEAIVISPPQQTPPSSTAETTT